jgi:hypothetical protein
MRAKIKRCIDRNYNFHWQKIPVAYFDDRRSRYCCGTERQSGLNFNDAEARDPLAQYYSASIGADALRRRDRLRVA